MDSPTAISLFSGAGGLDLGVKVALPGIRFVCHVEREAYAASILAARMEDKTLDAAPVWSDVSTFDGKPWHGKVDCIIGGFPCTDLSVAGKRAGINGAASGLWWEFARIILEVRPRWVFIENVPAVISNGPARAVLGELAALGFDAQWLTLRASDVGAPHQRKRVFILAYARGERRQQKSGSPYGDESQNEGWCSAHDYKSERDGETMAYRQGERSKERLAGSGPALANSDNGWPEQQQRGKGAQCGLPTGASAALANPGSRRLSGQREGENQQPRGAEAVSAMPFLADPRSGGQLRQLGPTGSAGFTEPCYAFPPGPGNLAAWQQVIDQNPDVAPSLEPIIRGMANGMAIALHERRHRLRSTGNGVVAIQAAVAFTVLSRRVTQ